MQNIIQIYPCLLKLSRKQESVTDRRMDKRSLLPYPSPLSQGDNKTDFPVVKVHVDELSSARFWQHKLCATLFANVNINYRLPIKLYYHICTIRHIRIEIIHGRKNVF
jgi:hypothetical protein